MDPSASAKTKEQKERAALRERKRKAIIVDQLSAVKKMLPGSADYERKNGVISQCMIIQAACGFINILETELKDKGIAVPKTSFRGLLDQNELYLKKAEEEERKEVEFTFGAVSTWNSKTPCKARSTISSGTSSSDDYTPPPPPTHVDCYTNTN